MEHYKDLGGESGIRNYEMTQDSIKIEFKDGSLYLYNRKRPGLAAVMLMQKLAIRGRGLNSFINTNVQKQYAAKLR